MIFAAPHRRGNAIEAPHKAGGLEARFEQMERSQRSFTDRILELEKVNEEQQLVIDKQTNVNEEQQKIIDRQQLVVDELMMGEDAVRRAPCRVPSAAPPTRLHALSWLAPRRRRSLPWSGEKAVLMAMTSTQASGVPS